MYDRHQTLRVEAMFDRIMGSFDELPDAYSPRSVAHQMRRVALKPSHAKRAKVKAARKQNHRRKA